MSDELTLGQKQRLFTRLIGQFIEHAYAEGYELTQGEAKRSDEQAVINSYGADGRDKLSAHLEHEFPALAVAVKNNGKANGILLSIHCDQLAEDFNLFKNGVYLDKTEGWAPLGEWWEKLHPLCRWGGRFRDGNHLSLEHNGRK